MRGKNSLSVTEIVLSSGSLPRVREKQLILQFINYTSRITPAYAGKTHTLTYAPSLDQDHPRVCGKNENLKLR